MKNKKYIILAVAAIIIAAAVIMIIQLFKWSETLGISEETPFYYPVVYEIKLEKLLDTLSGVPPTLPQLSRTFISTV